MSAVSPRPFLPPFIRASVSSASMTWKIVVALFPVAGICVYVFGLKALTVLALSVLSAVVSEAVWHGAVKKKIPLKDGNAVLTGLLAALLLPASAPWWIPALAGVFAVSVGREMFGGTGHYVFQPALLAKIFLLTFFPQAVAGWLLPMQIRWAALLLNSAIFTAGFFLIRARIIPPRLPFYYLATVLAVSLALGRDALCDMLVGKTTLMAFFYVPDFSCAPATEKGRIYFSVSSALLGSVLRFVCGLPDGEAYGILLINAVTPVFDRYIRPRFLGERT